MQLTTDEIKKVALLARLEFSDSELEPFAGQLGKIVSFVEKLNEVDTEGVELMAHPLDVHSVVREDQSRESLSHEAALSNSPNHDSEYFLVPPVLGKS